MLLKKLNSLIGLVNMQSCFQKKSHTSMKWLTFPDITLRQFVWPLESQNIVFRALLSKPQLKISSSFYLHPAANHVNLSMVAQVGNSCNFGFNIFFITYQFVCFSVSLFYINDVKII